MKRHGHSSRATGRTMEYNTWRAMKERCSNPSHKDYPRYGRRGITIDPAWKKFNAFLADMGLRPSSSHTLERVDNDLGYSKSNCIWATIDTQTRNRGGQRANRIVVVQGKAMCIADAATVTGVSISTIRNRLNRGLSDVEACASIDYRQCR